MKKKLSKKPAALIALFLMANLASAAPKKDLGVSQADPGMGLKNFREILSSLSVVTGVPVTAPDVSAYYTQVVSGLPRYGDLSEFNPQSFLADLGLASVFCNHVIGTDVSASGVVKTGPNAGVDFTQGPSHVSAAQRDKLAQNYISQFLQRAPTDTERTQLTQLFAAMTDAKDTADETQASVLAVCSAVAGSIEFLSN
jgi:hypothetical protein